METFAFYVLAALAVISSALVVGQRNPMYSVMLLIVSFGALSGLYVLLDAPFTAVTQIIVYAGAIMVLFLFVIMLLNLGRAGSDLRGSAAVTATVVAVGLLVTELWLLWSYTPDRLAAEVRSAAALTGAETIRTAVAERGVVGAVAAPLFETYLVPFEVTSVLLLAAIVGAVVLAKRRV